MPFATVRRADGRIVGSTRFFDIGRWAWPRHPGGAGRRPTTARSATPGSTRTAIRTAINTEAKYLMLRHAFESWGVHGVCFHTDARNERSCNALAGIGARFEGTPAGTPAVLGPVAARFGALLHHRRRVAAGARAPRWRATRRAQRRGSTPAAFPVQAQACGGSC